MLSQLETGEMLVCGITGRQCAGLLAIHQMYVIATSTSVDISSIDVPDYITVKYLEQMRRPINRENDEDIFETVQEVVSVLYYYNWFIVRFPIVIDFITFSLHF